MNIELCYLWSWCSLQMVMHLGKVCFLHIDLDCILVEGRGNQDGKIKWLSWGQLKNISVTNNFVPTMLEDGGYWRRRPLVVDIHRVTKPGVSDKFWRSSSQSISYIYLETAGQKPEWMKNLCQVGLSVCWELPMQVSWQAGKFSTWQLGHASLCDPWIKLKTRKVVWVVGKRSQYLHG